MTTTTGGLPATPIDGVKDSCESRGFLAARHFRCSSFDFDNRKMLLLLSWFHFDAKTKNHLRFHANERTDEVLLLLLIHQNGFRAPRAKGASLVHALRCHQKNICGQKNERQFEFTLDVTIYSLSWGWGYDEDRFVRCHLRVHMSFIDDFDGAFRAKVLPRSNIRMSPLNRVPSRIILYIISYMCTGSNFPAECFQRVTDGFCCMWWRIVAKKNHFVLPFFGYFGRFLRSETVQIDQLLSKTFIYSLTRFQQLTYHVVHLPLESNRRPMTSMKRSLVSTRRTTLVKTSTGYLQPFAPAQGSNAVRCPQMVFISTYWPQQNKTKYANSFSIYHLCAFDTCWWNN